MPLRVGSQIVKLPLVRIKTVRLFEHKIAIDKSIKLDYAVNPSPSIRTVFNLKHILFYYVYLYVGLYDITPIVKYPHHPPPLWIKWDTPMITTTVW